MLVKVNLPGEGIKEFKCKKFPVIIGRGHDCDITISSESISRKHMEITKDDGVIYIKDLTLSNWVSYNNEKLSKTDPVQFFDFAPLILPGDIELIIDNSDHTKGQTLVQSIEEQSLKDDNQTLTKTKYQSNMMSSKKPKRKYTKRKDIKKYDRNFLILGFVIIVLLLTLYLGGFVPGFSI